MVIEYFLFMLVFCMFLCCLLILFELLNIFINAIKELLKN